MGVKLAVADGDDPTFEYFVWSSLQDTPQKINMFRSFTAASADDAADKYVAATHVGTDFQVFVVPASAIFSYAIATSVERVS